MYLSHLRLYGTIIQDFCGWLVNDDVNQGIQGDQEGHPSSTIVHPIYLRVNLHSKDTIHQKVASEDGSCGIYLT